MPNQQLVRKYVGKQLAAYYAQPANKVVGHSSGVTSSKLSSLFWKRTFRTLHEEREGHWLTPVELFRPHYSRIVADFCMAAATNIDKTPKTLSRVEIIELGGGRGTNANLILSYLEESHPEFYENLKYTLVDSSPSLHRLQKDVLEKTNHIDRVFFEQKDLMDVAEKKTSLLSKSDTATIVIGMEVLDNLPHDKVRAKSRKRLEQAEVRITKKGKSEEMFVPLSDPLLAKVIRTVPSYTRPTLHPTWVPSVACGVISHLLEQRPNLSLAFADFDWLPPPELELWDSDDNKGPLSLYAEGEPIVTDMDSIDHQCYLTAPPHCDVLFPTNFGKLSSFVKRAIRDKETRSVRVLKQSDFLQTYGPEHVKATKNWLTGHTPLVDDFSNCSVLTVTPNAKAKQ